MKKRLLTIIVVVIAAVCSIQAQTSVSTVYYGEGDHHVQVEAGMDMCYGMPKFRDMTSKVKFGFYGEARYRFSGCPVDVGAYVSRDFTCRDLNGCRIDFCHTNVMLTADYNYRLGRFVTAFGGVGIGEVTAMDISDNAEIVTYAFGYSVAQSGPSAKFAFMPRVGITAWNILRLTVGYKVQGTLNSHGFVSLGLTLGLGRIKH